MMKNNFSGFTPLTESQAVLVVGGVDKKAQNALYTIGYVIGLVGRFIVTIFSAKGAKNVEAI